MSDMTMVVLERRSEGRLVICSFASVTGREALVFGDVYTQLTGAKDVSVQDSYYH